MGLTGIDISCNKQTSSISLSQVDSCKELVEFEAWSESAGQGKVTSLQETEQFFAHYIVLTTSPKHYNF